MEQSAKYSVQGITSAFVGELQDDLDTLKDVKTGKVQLLCDDVDYPVRHVVVVMFVLVVVHVNVHVENHA